tara:strand:- start:6704 stop:7696 length:993 start_codon:yes stop_codon:yes gene_type:complete
MANAAFSPRDFKAWIIEEATPGTIPTITSGLYQLDVDSVSMPSLNVNQLLDVRTSTGRVLSSEDFFQDNKNRVTEVSLSGIFHKDIGHTMLLQNVCGASMGSVADVSLAYNATGVTGKYGVAQNDATFTLVLASPDTTDGFNLIVPGAMCTNFQISADSTADGGVYKFSATIQSGRIPTLNDTTTEAGTAYTANPISISTLTTKKVYSADVILSNFGVTIDSPAVYAGTSANGYEAFTRGAEISVTATAQSKYDSATRGFINSFDGQVAGGHDAADSFTMTQSTATDCSIDIPSAVLTNTALSEGDIMMIDTELKAVNIGSGNVITFDLA